MSVLGWAIFENRTLTADLVEVAMKVCDRHGDGDVLARKTKYCEQRNPDGNYVMVYADVDWDHILLVR